MRGWWVGVVGCAMLWSSVAAAQDAEADREAAMFGEEEEEPLPGEEPPAAEAEPVVQADFGEALTSDSELIGRLSASYDTLDIGGRLFLRLDTMRRDEQSFGESALSSQNLLDLYLDARPSDRVRAFVNGRLTFDPTVSAAGGTSALGAASTRTNAQLDQLWLKYDVEGLAYVTVGKQRVKWGAGRFWNPTDFLNQQRLDPLAVFDQRLGVDLARIHIPFQSTNINTYLIATLDDATSPEKIGVAGRVEALLGSTEVTASAAWRSGAPLRLGATASTGVGWLDLRLEGALTRGDAGPYWEGDFAPERFVVPTAVDRRDEWIAQVVTGGELSIPIGDDDSFILGMEYLYNQAGYESADLYPWLLLAGGFTPLYLGRHYGAVYALVPSPGQLDDWTFVLSTLGNLSDGSLLTRFDVNVQALTFLTVNLYAAAHYGEVGELRFGVEIPPVAAIPELSNGFSVPPSLMDVGASVRVNL